MLKKREKQVLFELLEEGRKTDREIARRIKTTQPTVTRVRQKLEKEGYIARYKAITDLEKSNLMIIVVTFFRWMDFSAVKDLEKFEKFFTGQSQTLMFARGEGLEGRTHVLISAHRDFQCYEKFLEDARKAGGPYLSKVIQFISSIDSILKRYDSASAVISAISAEESGDEG